MKSRRRKSLVRYNSRDEIIKDVTFILSSDVASATKAAVLKRAIWNWSEMDGKYKGCRFWTARARLSYLEPEIPGKPKRGLRHEHIVPRKVVANLLLNLNPPTLVAVREIFERFVIAVVVHIQEDEALNRFKSTMPSTFDPKSSDVRVAWMRYDECGIIPIDSDQDAALFDSPRKLRQHLKRSSHSATE